jgi:hypothetical protein
MSRAVLIMACVAATSAVSGATILALPARTEQGVYGKRIAGTMFCAMALILTLYAFGLQRMGA